MTPGASLLGPGGSSSKIASSMAPLPTAKSVPAAPITPRLCLYCQPSVNALPLCSTSEQELEAMPVVDVDRPCCETCQDEHDGHGDRDSAEPRCPSPGAPVLGVFEELLV